VRINVDAALRPILAEQTSGQSRGSSGVSRGAPWHPDERMPSMAPSTSSTSARAGWRTRRPGKTPSARSRITYKARAGASM
jgi:hypothetical protein